MKSVRTNFGLSVLIMLLGSCAELEEETIRTTHFNIHIVPDLSNRVDNKLTRSNSSHDTIIINDLVDLYLPKIYPYRRAIYQKDMIRLTRINMRNQIKGLNELSLKSFDNNQKERIQYVKDTVGGLTNDLKRFKKNIAKVYEQRKDKSLNWSGDIFNFMQNSLTELNTERDSVVNKVDDAVYIEKFKNIVFLFTDGYIEYGDFAKATAKNSHYHLGTKLVGEIRAKCLADNLSPSEVLQKYDIKLEPVKNPLLRYYDFVVLELDDRSLNAAGSALKRPTDQEIIQALWARWLKESGVKSWVFYSIGDADAKEIVEQHVLGEKPGV